MTGHLPLLFLLGFGVGSVSCQLLSVDGDGTAMLQISLGPLRGKLVRAYDNREGYAFLGVPFGAPPVGNLRFAKPQPAQSWTGIRDSTEMRVACPAVAALTYKRVEGGPMDEDCLHNYIYTSIKCMREGGCPIVFIVHGGKFNFESPVIFPAENVVHNFASQDIVVVITAYRLENFGFLNIAPGLDVSATPNTGIHDILLSLKWVHKEIVHFGGDPKRITIFGHSAGAMAVDMITLSPHFTGLYAHTIVMSGTRTHQHTNNHINHNSSWKTAELLGCLPPNTNKSNITAIEGVLACMRSKSWQEIVQANIALNDFVEDYVGPTMDGPNGLFPESNPILAKTRHPVPTLLGTVTAEFREPRYAYNETTGKPNKTQVEELCTMATYGLGYENPESMTRACIAHYMTGNRIIDIEQDVEFFRDAYFVAKTLTERGAPVYLYSFGYKGIGQAFKKYKNGHPDDHPSHSEEYVYILGLHRGNFTEKDFKIEDNFCGLLRSFIKTGHPETGPGQLPWTPFTTSGQEYYSIDFPDDSLLMPGTQKMYQKTAIELWGRTAERIGGRYLPPTEVPFPFDMLEPMDAVTAFASEHENTSFAHDKTLEAEKETYRIWTEYISDRRFKHLNGIKNFRHFVSEVRDVPVPIETSNNIVEILIICVSAILLFIIFRCCLHCAGVYQERKGYETLPDS